ncbi:hypothetical protein COCMIDRAFT_40349 [Bipolaris oryzae ATCC 44560]|uniref:C2H2-type domain-containing protein n=1 Tax=Bipolaris oryzae ATCC 44560 TaxID=930090 RepID=W6YVC2_COCMI|nr:uncharacterized protein COCMIDRAFT_40349 [Bipolaris oryzae ATCC 44560]EUC41493.1 hypothetical protein COCMIDRAFT_40349 [Bipolaris oryzae ATCC 44560]
MFWWDSDSDYPDFRCTRCDREFSNQYSLRQHRRDASDHYSCDSCDFVGATRAELLTHHDQTRHATICRGCNNGRGRIWGSESQEYLDHLEDGNVCGLCETHFETPSNLEHHEMTHLERTIECYGCCRKFPTYPAMIIHLEAATCVSGIDIRDLNQSAAMCFQWKAYLDQEYRQELLERVDLKAMYGRVYPFRCPGCKLSFTKLSGLFQHVYSNACRQDLHEGKMAKLIKWLENRHDI